MKSFEQFNRYLIAAIVCVLASPISAEQSADYIPKPGEFPPAGAGQYLAGELVSVDHVNRRGALRLVGENSEDQYHSAPSHPFAMLPFGTLRYHGAPAELRDIPIGTMLHGYFLLPPEGDTKIIVPNEGAKFVSKYTHALSVEDDFSFYKRREQSWKIVSIDREKGQLKAVLTGPAADDGLNGEKTFEIDRSTRVWRAREFGKLEDLAAEQAVQINLTWGSDWQNGLHQIADVWIDDESCTISTERQRQIHLRYQRTHWLAGWVDHVEHQPGGAGIVTLTLFGGMDPTLYETVRAKGGGEAIAAAEWTLRSFWQNHDNKYGSILDVKDSPSPPMGSSGLQVRFQVAELLEGFRPGRIIRFRPNGFSNVKLPPEERVQGMNDR